MNAYPSSTDYVDAVLQQEQAFRLPALQQAVFATDPYLGIPMVASGSAAVVFRAAVEGADQALRFYIQEDVSERRRYERLQKHFDSTPALRNCVAGSRWIDDAVEVNGTLWPMVQMEWVEGRTLDKYVDHLAESRDVGALRTLAGTWRDRVRQLQQADFAHGDLQHGNVLVDTSATLRLVDFDACWIADFQGWPEPRETGNPNYQRPGRIWGRWMDTFPALVIYAGLLALSRRPDVWSELHDGESMLFRHTDFTDLQSETWKLLGEITDREVGRAVDRLRFCCQQPAGTIDGPLDELLGVEKITPAPRPDRVTAPPFVLPPNPSWGDGAPPTPSGLPAPPPKFDPQHTHDDSPGFVGVTPSSSDVPVESGAGGWAGTGTGPRISPIQPILPRA